ncbi:MAG: hypothetical protein HY816_02530 [Candidatus Wallbacteria bacterium]|nr:hypothetical protein [Candidatus Wallbacteria bacterium]
MLSGTGCVRVSKVSDVEELKTRVGKLEQRAEAIESSIKVNERMAALEARLAELSRPAVAAPVAPLSSDPAAQTAAPATVPVAAPVAAVSAAAAHPERFGGEYRQGIGTDPPSLDPAQISDTTSHRVGLNIFEGLVEFKDEDLSVVPLLARSWEVSPDGRVYTFEIRPGVKFHTGREVTAEDFVYSFRRLLDPKTASVRAWLFDEVLGYPVFKAIQSARGQLKYQADGQYEKVEATRIEEAIRFLDAVDKEHLTRAEIPEPDKVLATIAKARGVLKQLADALAQGREAAKAVAVDAALMQELEAPKFEDYVKKGIAAPAPMTLRIELAKPFAPFLTVLAMPNAGVVPREEIEKWGDRFSEHPVGTGPFKFASWQHNVVVELEAFKDYFLGRPYLDKMRFRVIPDESVRLNEFEIGNLEHVNEVPDEKYETIKATKDYPGVLEECETLSTFYMGFNMTKKPFDDLRVRQAFSHAIDKHTILNVIRRGRGKVANGVLPPGMPAYNPELKASDYDKEKAIALLKEAGYEDRTKLGELEYWYNATSSNDPNARLAEVIQQNLLQIGVKVKLQTTDWSTYLKKVDRGELALFRMAWVADYPDPDNFLYILFHSKNRGEAGNYSMYNNPKVDELLERGRTTLGMADRVKIYQELEKQIVADSPWTFLYHSRQPFLRKPYVKGVVFTPLGNDAIRMRGAWLDQSQMKPGN